MTDDCLYLPRGPIDDPPYPHCRHCADECARTHYDPCTCQEAPR